MGEKLLSNAAFLQEITDNQEIERAPVHLTEMEAGGAKVVIRERGCFIPTLELIESETGIAVPVLYSEDDLEKPKLSASHPMSPVGPYKGIGGQHGYPRWADYQKLFQEEGLAGEHRTVLQAKRSDDGLSLARELVLDATSLQITNTIRSSVDTPTSTSFGEHFYFRLTDETSKGLRFDGAPLDDFLQESGVLSRIMEGNSYFWSGFDGEVVIEFPDGKQVRLTAEAMLDTEKGKETLSHKVGMLLWHRPGSESICFEPVVGFTEADGREGGTCEIPRYGGMQFTTTIELVDSERYAWRRVVDAFLILCHMSDELELQDIETLRDEDYEDALTMLYNYAAMITIPAHESSELTEVWELLAAYGFIAPEE